MELQDWKLSELGEDIWKKKYQRNGESFEDWLERVSGGDTQVAQLRNFYLVVEYLVIEVLQTEV